MLVGNRITLSLLEEEDLPYLVHWRNQPDIRRQFFNKTLIGYAGQAQWYRQYLEDGTKQIFIARMRSEQQQMGMIGLHHMDAFNRQAELGSTMIGNRKLWGKGIGEEMIQVLLDYAFTDLNMNRIYAYAIDDNQASIRVKQKCGFKIEGVLRQAHCHNGQYHDVILLGLIRADWAPGLRKEDPTD